MTAQPITIVIVEDNPRTVEYLQQMLESTATFCTGAIYTSVEKALTHELKADELWLIDLRLPGLSGIELITRLRGRSADVRLCCFTAVEEAQVITEAIIAGADGYIIKDASPHLLLLELETVARGGTTLTPRVAQKIFQQLSAVKNSASPLAGMESRVLQRMANGYTYTQIADELQMAPGTARKHIENIYRKLRVHSKSEAIRKSRESGWLN